MNQKIFTFKNNITFLKYNLLNFYCNSSFAEDYDKCILEAQRLNEMRRKEMKSDSLFDSDQPRKATMKFKATLGQRVKSKKSADIKNNNKKIVENNNKKVCIIFTVMNCGLLDATNASKCI